uniref:Testicular tissue protein Li 46 n=1 Tax=Homo sapiens TaxID=9606 RepID=A0A140VJH2_HUMAN|nr:testicular tissue protein Li 46 [Homo sapiens]
MGQVHGARARSEPTRSGRGCGAPRAVGPVAHGRVLSGAEPRSLISWKLVVVLFTVLLPGSLL